MHTTTLPLLSQAALFADRTAITDHAGSYTYTQLMQAAQTVASNLVSLLGAFPGPVLYLAPSGFNYVAVQWGIWLAGGIAVPVHPAHPVAEIGYLVADTQTALLLYDDVCKTAATAAAPELARPLTAVLGHGEKVQLPEVAAEADALMIYTSGTTGKPKGVVMSHAQIAAQVISLSQAWGWQASDRILNVLPMHHVHGIINILCCALYNGAICEMEPGFDARHVMERMCSGQLTLFMAVPTIYHKLIQHYHNVSEPEQQRWSLAMQAMRLMVCGSAALPVPVLEQWKAISGQVLLERYGMTEIGMALSNPLEGERKPGFVGKPLPGVAVKLCDEAGTEIVEADTPGELYVSGATVFKRYWQRPEATAEAFVGHWFKTGDIAQRDAAGHYKILGRSSQDIIKSGGYKISALEIEEVLLAHPDVKECAVVALPDEQWGEIIAAVWVAEGDAPHPDALPESWLKSQLAHYKVPRKWLRVSALPRNAMGKVLKPDLRKQLH